MNQSALNARGIRKIFVPRKEVLAEVIRFLDLAILENLDLSKIEESREMFIGTCPFCGGHRTFVLWRDRAEFRCARCGADGRFGPAPEWGERCPSGSPSG